MANLYDLRAQLSEAYDDLADTEMMDEDAACFHCNTDTKEDAITIIREWIEGLIAQIERAEEEEEIERARDAKPEYHFAFASEREFWNYKGF